MQPDAMWPVYQFAASSQVRMRACTSTVHFALVGISFFVALVGDWHELPQPNLSLLADLSRTRRSQRPAQIPATGQAMKKRRTAQRRAKTGLPDMVN